MLRFILTYGAIAGLVVGIPLFVISTTLQGQIPPAWGMAIGYLTMLIALTAVFVAIKRRRDRELGGVIRFWPAFGLGLAISLVAAGFYVIAWEAALVAGGGADGFIDGYVAQLRAAGGDPAETAATIAQMEGMRASYRNPLVRIPITLVEFLPIGILVSLVSAALLRNPRFLAARRDAALA